MPIKYIVSVKIYFCSGSVIAADLVGAELREKHRIFKISGKKIVKANAVVRSATRIKFGGLIGNLCFLRIHDVAVSPFSTKKQLALTGVRLIVTTVCISELKLKIGEPNQLA